MKTIDPTRAKIDVIVDQLDDLLNDSDFAAARRLIDSYEPEDMANAEIVSVLGITLAAASKLQPERHEFFCAGKHVVAKRIGEEKASKLLNKYAVCKEDAT